MKRLRGIPSDQEVWRQLWADPELREICGFEEGGVTASLLYPEQVQEAGRT